MSQFSTSNAPAKAIAIYQTHRLDKLGEGASDEQSHRHGLRMLHNSGWYRGKGGWKQLHGDVRDKINIRDPIRQPDGTYVIEDVDCFYPNASKGHFFDADRIKELISNTNKMIEAGSQRPGLIEGHIPSEVDELPMLQSLAIGKQFSPVGYAVNWRENSHRLPGWVKCDLVDVSPEFIARQRSRPLTGLSAGISQDIGGLNQRFNHVAILGSTLQALSRLPRTELSEVFSSNSVCFASSGADIFTKGKTMPTNPHKEMADCYAAFSAAYSSIAAGEPEAKNKLDEARSRFKTHYESNKAFFDSMPDEPLMKQAAKLETQPAEGPHVITEEGPDLGTEQKHEGRHEFSAEEMDDPRIAQLVAENAAARNRVKQAEILTAGAVGRLVRKDFDSEIADLRRQGHELPPDQAIADQFQVCYSSANPKQALAGLLGMFKAMPRKSSPASLGTVLGASGNTEVPGTAKTAQEKRSYRTKAHEDMGIHFSAEEIDFGLKIGEVVNVAYPKAN